MQPLPLGTEFFPGFLDPATQQELVATIREIIRQSPLFVPKMPRTGKDMSVRMTNCGSLGWVTDQAQGYRYQQNHPVTGRPWLPIPARLLQIWDELVAGKPPPQACLINFYDASAKMGLHQDRDERDFSAPVLSISLGDACRFRIGGENRNDPTRSFRLESGDVVILGGQSRLAFHGVDRIYPGTSTLLKNGGRINLTLRRVNAE